MKQFISLFLTFVFLMVSIALLTFAFFLTRTPDGPAPEIVEEQQQPEEDLESIFLGHPIFIGRDYYYSTDRHPDYEFDLRHNRRYLDFDHIIFPADQITDEDIINWSVTYLRRQGDWGIINLDNGNQLQVQVFSSQFAVNDTFTISYREQENNSADQSRADWWTIAHGQFSIDSELIGWQDLEENRISSPFE